MPTYQDYLRATELVLCKSQQELFPYITKVMDYEFVVYENVFSPKYFRDTEIFAKHLTVHSGEHLLEIGPGTGAVSVIKALEGAGRVIAIDINNEAVKNTRDNIIRHRVGHILEVRRGNLFGPLFSGELFDTIFWNTPFGNIEKTRISLLQKAVFDPLYRDTRRFLNQGPNFLKPNGRLVIGFSSTLGRPKELLSLCQEASLELHCIHQETSEEIYPVKFELFEAKPK